MELRNTSPWNTCYVGVFLTFLVAISILFLSVWKIHLTRFFGKKAPCFNIIDVIKSWPVPAKQVGIPSGFITVTSIIQKNWEKNLVLLLVFKRKQVQGFSWGTGGPPGGKNFAHPPTDRGPRFLTSPNWVLSPKTSKISKILPHFTLNFDYFLAQNCIQKALFYA